MTPQYPETFRSFQLIASCQIWDSVHWLLSKSPLSSHGTALVKDEVIIGLGSGRIPLTVSAGEGVGSGRP